jgi:FkbH-like protein
LEFALNCLPAESRVDLAPLSDIEGYVASSLQRERVDARVVVWRAQEMLPNALYPYSSGSTGQAAEQVAQVQKRIGGVVELHQRHAPGVPLFVGTLPVPLKFSHAFLPAQHRENIQTAVGRINETIYTLVSNNTGIYVLDIAAWAAREGINHADPLTDFAARQPFSASGQFSFAFFVARCLRPLVVPRKKVLAIDLDNTLWGGIIGEDGIKGLQVGHDFPGNVHLALQRELLELRNRGVLLVLLSKNNEADVDEAFQSLVHMVLKLDDFAVRKINWKHKYANLCEAAEELGFGLNSFVFIDDSHFEREQMRQLAPDVLILNDSDDPLQILCALWATDAFDSLVLTDEDRRRHDDYALRTAREVRGHEDHLEDFLHSMQMEVGIEEVGGANFDRVVAMLGKTNQFNLTTRRHSAAQLHAMITSPRAISLALRLRDKFGDQGIVAVLLAVPVDSATLIVDSFLVSCRALGRRVEDALWSVLLDRAKAQGIRRLQARFVPTAKNGIVESLYDRLGLRKLDESSSGIDYELDPIRSHEFPSWIQLSEEGAHESRSSLQPISGVF